MVNSTFLSWKEGQLISKCSFDVIVSSKIPTEKFDKFCPIHFRAEFVKFFCCILVKTMKPKGHFEINWPLWDLGFWSLKTIKGVNFFFPSYTSTIVDVLGLIFFIYSNSKSKTKHIHALFRHCWFGLYCWFLKNKKYVLMWLKNILCIWANLI